MSLTISREILAERRPWKTPISPGPIGGMLDRGKLDRPGHAQLMPTRRPWKKIIQLGGEERSAFITTRCYSPSGVQLWTGDHGNTVYALCVDASGVIYQSGANAGGIAPWMGDSLFHSATGGVATLVTAMRFGGQPVWSVVQNSGGSKFSYGIAATTSAVYCGINDTISPSHVAKLAYHTGEELTSLPVAGFVTGPPAVTDPGLWVNAKVAADQSYGRVRVDAAGCVYAVGETTSGTTSGGFSYPLNLVTTSVFKWVGDAESWIFNDCDFRGMFVFGTGATLTGITGLGVSSLGSVSTSRNSTDPTLGSWPVFYTSTSTPNLSPHIYSSISVNRRVAPSPSSGGYRNVGVSPSGRRITYSEITHTLIAITEGVDQYTVTETTLASVPFLGGSFAVPNGALAINDSGIIAHSIDRSLSSPTGTHEIRNTGGVLVARLDHGGAINDCVVLPNGNVIVAGERVRRKDFP